MASQLGPRGGSLGVGIPKSGLHTHTRTHDRLDKSRSALAEVPLKTQPSQTSFAGGNKEFRESRCVGFG